MTQQTSIESYRKLKDERVLNQRLWEALEFIIKNERVVARSIPNAGWKRCSALKAMGLIKQDGHAFDTDTNRTVKVWVPTGIESAQVKRPEPELDVLATLVEVRARMEAFFDPEGNPPENTGEFRELKEAVQMMDTVIASRKFGKAGKRKRDVSDEMLDALEDKIELLEQKQKDLTEKLVKLDEANRMLHLALMEKNALLDSLQNGGVSGIIKP